ncbi:Transaldolase [Nymphaea thermarum]|nr:Transaldolase [Nymphaea thermarum]
MFSSSSSAFFSVSPKHIQERSNRWSFLRARPSLSLRHQQQLPIFFITAAASSSANASSIEAAPITELDAVSAFSEIVPDTVIFDDFERFPPTAATVSSSLLLGITSLPDTKFKSAIETALADGQCYAKDDPKDRLGCFFNKALVNVGAELVKEVPGRVSTEVDARLAYDTHGIVRKVHELLKLYAEVEVPQDRLLFKIPSTWQGIEASRLLESEGIQTHLTFVYRIGPGIIPLTLKLKLLEGEVKILGLHWVDYLIAPLKLLQSLKESEISPDEKYSFFRRLTPAVSNAVNFSEEELVNWDQLTFASAIGPAAEELLSAGVEGYINQTRRVEEFFDKIWPPPNV